MSNIEAGHQVHKADFILHIKQYNLLKDFQIADPESEFHWKKKADLAFRQTLKHILTFICHLDVNAEGLLSLV